MAARANLAVPRLQGPRHGLAVLKRHARFADFLRRGNAGERLTTSTKVLTSISDALARGRGGTMSATITLPLPPSVNALWRSGKGRTFRSRRYISWLKEAGRALKAQRPPRFTDAVVIKVDIGRPGT